MQNKRVNSIQISEPKVRVKMWKSKKRWVCGAVLFAAMGIGMSTTHSVSAATGEDTKTAAIVPKEVAVSPEVNKDSEEAVQVDKTSTDYKKGLLAGKLSKKSDKPDLTNSSVDFKAGYTDGLVVAIKEKMVEAKTATTVPNEAAVPLEVNENSVETVPINKKAVDHELGLLTGKYKKASDKPDLTDSSEDFKAGYTEGLVIAIKQKMVEIKPTTTVPDEAAVPPEVNENSVETVPINKKAIDHELGLLTGKYKKASDKPDLTDSSEDFKAGYTEGLVIAVRQKIVEATTADDAKKSVTSTPKEEVAPKKPISVDKSLNDYDLGLLGGTLGEKPEKQDLPNKSENFKAGYAKGLLMSIREKLVEAKIVDDARKAKEAEEAKKKADALLEIQKLADVPTKLIEAANSLKNGNISVTPFGGADIEVAAKNHEQVAKNKAKVQVGIHTITTKIENVEKMWIIQHLRLAEPMLKKLQKNMTKQLRSKLQTVRLL